MAEAEGGGTRVKIVPLVECVSNLDCLVFALVTIRVANERCLPVIVEVGVGDRGSIDTMGKVKEAIIVVLVMVTVRPEFDRIDPDAVRSLDSKSIARISEDLVDLA
jgi:hypothetical protein